jgi:N-acetylglucosaminyldiphosphoundecaprenol N-acetyl-beta-D-mannosaminyltransferase
METLLFFKKIRVINTTLQPTSYAELSDWLYRHGGRGPCRTIDFTNIHIVTLRALDAEFQFLTEDIDYFVPDSMPLTWCVNLLGGKMNDRVYGPAFMNHCLRHSPPETRHYFLGGSLECLDRLIRNSIEQNPHLNIVGSHHGFFQSDQEPGIINQIVATQPDCIWIGLGTPKQQQFSARNRRFFPSGTLLLVGFAFDVNAKTKKDAPLFMQKTGMTWVFRMLCEPRRLVPRYVKYNSLYLIFFAESLLSSLCRRFLKALIIFFLVSYVAGMVVGLVKPISALKFALILGVGPICLLGALVSVLLAMSLTDEMEESARLPRALISLNAILSFCGATFAPLGVLLGVLAGGGPGAMTGITFIVTCWAGAVCILAALLFFFALLWFRPHPEGGSKGTIIS